MHVRTQDLGHGREVMGASDEEDQVHVKQPRDPVRVDAQMRRTTSSSATFGVARRTCGSVPGGLVQGDLHRPHEGAVDFDMEAWDDVTGKALDPKALRQARLKEMKYVMEKEVWQPISREEARRRGWKVVKTRWIDINKGDEDTPNYRSRLVAKQFNDCAGEGLFASTPPLEALRFLISEAATVRGEEGWEDKVIMVNDVARAFFDAPMRRDICVELPAEGGEGEDMVGHLIMSLHGTRNAANFQEEVRSFMNKNKADQSKYSPSVYHNKEYGLITLVHGDDFITVGNRKNIRWFNNKLEGRFEIKTKIIGQGEGGREARVLNRILRVLGVRAGPETRGYLDPGHEPLRSQGSQGAGRGREELGDKRERPGRGLQGGDALSSARGTSQLFGLGPHGLAVCDEGGVQRHGGADEGTCEEIEEAHPIPH